MARKMNEIREARETLRETLHPGDTIYTVLRHVSRSCMYRAIDAYVLRVDDDGKPYPIWLSPYVAKALDTKFDKNYDAVGMSGCGMDMGFALVNDLSRVLFENGYKLTHKWL